MNQDAYGNIQEAFRESVSSEIQVASAGVRRFVVHVPFTFADGDHYVVILRPEDGIWTLSDEGHTLMHLSYELTDFEFSEGRRKEIIDRIVSSYGIEDRNGELVAVIPEGRYGDALFSFLQAITRITDVTFLNREQVKETFREDFEKLVTEKAKAVGLEEPKLHYTHPTRDEKGRYPVDAWVNGKTTQQILVMGINNDDQCRDATITLHQWEKWQEKFHSIAVFRDQTQINRFVLARFSDVAGRQLTSLEIARERVASYFSEFLRR